MKYYHLQIWLTIITLFGATVTGAMRSRLMDLASKIICVLLGAAFLTECIAYYAAVKFHNNNPVYAVYNIIEMGLAALYFNYSVTSLYKWNIGIYIAIAGVAAGLINDTCLQSVSITDSNFMVFEGLIIIALSLYSLIQLLANTCIIDSKSYPHFWFVLIQLFFWCLSLLSWLLYDQLTQLLGSNKWIIDFSLYLVSIISNIAFAVIFFLYPEMCSRYEYNK